jgi:lipoprotein NlpI
MIFASIKYRKILMTFRTTILGWLLMCGVVSAQPTGNPATETDLCRNTQNNPEAAIKHCTAAIEGRKANNEMLAQWYVLRGTYWTDMGDYDRAIADHTAALKLDAKVRHAHYFRGIAWSNKGEFERAIAEFDTAAQTNANEPVIYHARGIELAIKGDYRRAVADFDKALQLDAKAQGVHFARGRALFYQGEFLRAAADFETALATRPSTYTALWLFLARKRGGNPDSESMLERETRRLRSGWPAPVVALYMERTDTKSVMASATTPDAVRERELRCEANFYIAQSHVIKGQRADAQKLLQVVQQSCPKNLLEYEGAVAELRRLNQP